MSRAPLIDLTGVSEPSELPPSPPPNKATGLPRCTPEAAASPTSDEPPTQASPVGPNSRTRTPRTGPHHTPDTNAAQPPQHLWIQAKWVGG